MTTYKKKRKKLIEDKKEEVNKRGNKKETIVEREKRVDRGREKVKSAIRVVLKVMRWT